MGIRIASPAASRIRGPALFQKCISPRSITTSRWSSWTWVVWVSSHDSTNVLGSTSIRSSRMYQPDRLALRLVILDPVRGGDLSDEGVLGRPGQPRGRVEAPTAVLGEDAAVALERSGDNRLDRGPEHGRVGHREGEPGGVGRRACARPGRRSGRPDSPASRCGGAAPRSPRRAGRGHGTPGGGASRRPASSRGRTASTPAAPRGDRPRPGARAGAPGDCAPPRRRTRTPR